MPSSPESLPPAPNRAPDFDDDFSGGGAPDPRRWVAAYLPHWTTPDRARARFETVTTGLQLRIDADQPDWRPEDSPLRVSNLQTGLFSGPVGSPRGTHRHRADLTVRTETPLELLFAPSRGRVEVTVSASRDPGCMTAAWLVGTEHRSPSESGEICLFEIDAEAVGETTTAARTGVKAHHDPALTTDMAEVEIPLDASQPHTWTAIWGDGVTLIGCEGRVVRRIARCPDYPLFLMIDLFETAPPGGSYPKSATVHRVRAWH
ncbi:family 16 glycosylhydrolase [Herbiconiux sp. KACC 21604]|uniref:family 16 glycosylhydrolase n=1 Tax=unclassified Herbiconiux TaxID=2618217 RepID=UPI001490A6EE|nr:family 16 glycosylhydrolase [Herbiconiux sp. SALV-R1]QJU54641.1 glycoside hydrolase family 16 protein [Herbiconiux sp. SALV-R1]WPO85739.1 family 16 glycosylhydrolase [Herbiconiux sp. KACC 21604]